MVLRNKQRGDVITLDLRRFARQKPPKIESLFLFPISSGVGTCQKSSNIVDTTQIDYSHYIAF